MFRMRLRWPAVLALLTPEAALAFCGFYVAGGDAKLFNQASQVVLVRDGDRTVMTISSDYRGDLRQFALVVPVPVVLDRGQIHVGERDWVEHVDAFSAPRLVEYHDPNPCGSMGHLSSMIQSRADAVRVGPDLHFRGGRLREAVVEEARYHVDEYEIVILSATESNALARWLTTHGYRIPAGASRALDAYVKQGMKFFVAKVALDSVPAQSQRWLRPLQIAYESPKFVLPVRLGMANANGPQELFVYVITRAGRAEPVNYRTVRWPAASDVPRFVRDDFANVYRAAFERLSARHGLGVVFTEHFWNVGTCDPCAGPPLAADELRALGAWWVDPMGSPRAAQAFVTRLHARYDRASFPEDLVLQVTADKTPYQARLVVRHEWSGDSDCTALATYHAELRERREREARTLVGLTGWSLADIRQRMAVREDWSKPGERTSERPKWWEALWSSVP